MNPGYTLVPVDKTNSEIVFSVVVTVIPEHL